MDSRMEGENREDSGVVDALVVQVEALTLQHAALESGLRELDRRSEQQTLMLEQLLAMNRQPEATPGSTLTPSTPRIVTPSPLSELPHDLPAPTSTAKPFRHSSPPEFSGKRSEYSDFVGQLDLYFLLNERTFPSDRQRVLFAVSRLRGMAYKWAEPKVKEYKMGGATVVPWMEDYGLFVAELEKIYGDGNLVATAERQILVLKQTHGVQAYVTAFQTVAARLQSWGNSALASHFYVGLKNSIKDQIARVG